MKIELDSAHVSITRNGEDMVACIRIKAVERLIVGDTVSGLLDEVIGVVERRIVACKKDLQTIRGIQRLRGTCEGAFPEVRVEPYWRDELETCKLIEGSTAPETLKIGEYEVPEPCREVPEVGQKVWMFHPINRVEPFTWYNSKTCHDALKNGFVHLTEEAAEKHYEAFKDLLGEKS